MTREEAIDCINAIHVQMFNCGNSKWTEACDMAISDMKEMDRLAKAEPVLKEPDRPLGEWLPDFIYHGLRYHKCNQCKVATVVGNITDFCPNCGSDNRKREGSNTKCEFANKCGISKACERGGVIKDTCHFIKKEGDENA